MLVDHVRLLSPRTYSLYGARVESPWRLPCPEACAGDPPEIILIEERGPLANVPDCSGEWFCHSTLGDGSDYLCWRDLFEFVISPSGQEIRCVPLQGATWDSFQTYMLGAVLSFALLRLNREPLHATAVVVAGRAVGLAAQPGAGKSTLAAAFLRAGHRLLTDDLLVLEGTGGVPVAYPGLPRLKLFPEIADALLDYLQEGARMNPLTHKRVLTVPAEMFCQDPVPLAVLYILNPVPSGQPQVRALAGTQAFRALTASLFNTRVTRTERLQNHLRLIADTASHVPVKSLSYQRDMRQLPAIVEAILQDVG